MTRNPGGNEGSTRHEAPAPHLIRESNWSEYEAKGFFVIEGNFDQEKAEELFGPVNVYPGDAWDEEAGRPLRHKPGTSLYSNDHGMEYLSRWMKREAGEI